MSLLIEQQIYTRERRGLFRGSEGYDSVAKSAGLTDAFVKESVHCYCGYSPSRRLQAEDAPPEAYPAAYTFARYPDGRSLLGRAVYVAADFTGQRSTFFAHNYVLPEGYELDAGLIERVEFLGGYDIANGNELPGLNELPVKELIRKDAVADLNAPPVTDAATDLDTPLNTNDSSEMDASRVADVSANAVPSCTQALFSRLVVCIVQSLASAKKIYVQVPVPPEDTSRYALGVLKTLYGLLPPSLTRGLGFLTYAREPENKKGLHIVFLESGTLRQGDPRVARDFFIDASAEPAGEESVFAEFLWKTGEAEGETGGNLTAFYHFLTAFKENMTLEHWDLLTRIFLINRKDGPEGKDSAESKYGPKGASGIFDSAARAFLNLAKEKPETAPALAELARQAQTEFFAAYVSHLLESGAEEFLADYAGEKFNLQSAPDALFREAGFWLENVPDVFKCESFVNIFKDRAALLLDDASEPIKTAAKLYDGARDFPVSLDGVIDSHLMPRLDFAGITRAQLADLHQNFILYGKKSAPGKTKSKSKTNVNAQTYAQSGGGHLPYLLLEILKKISRSLDAEKAISLSDFIGSYDLPAKEKKYLLVKLREFYADFVSPPHFENISLLFKDRAELLSFVNGNASAETKAAFLVWAVDSRKIDSGDTAQWEAAKNFIALNIKDGAFKERIYLHPALKALSREMRFGVLARFMS